MEQEIYNNMVKALGQETIAADLLRDENSNLKNEIDNLKRIMTEKPRTIDYLIQEKVDEAVLRATDDLPDESKVHDIVYDKMQDMKDELEDGLVDKVIKAIVERLEY
jgi:hypothetical protein